MGGDVNKYGIDGTAGYVQRATPVTTNSIIRGSCMDDSTFERHFSIAQLATQWNYGRESVRRLVMHEPGVLRLKLGRKKSNCAYSVPESVARRIHTRLLNAA